MLNKKTSQVSATATSQGRRWNFSDSSNVSKWQYWWSQLTESVSTQLFSPSLVHSINYLQNCSLLTFHSYPSLKYTKEKCWFIIKCLSQKHTLQHMHLPSTKPAMQGSGREWSFTHIQHHLLLLHLEFFIKKSNFKMHYLLIFANNIINTISAAKTVEWHSRGLQASRPGCQDVQLLQRQYLYSFSPPESHSPLHSAPTSSCLTLVNKPNKAETLLLISPWFWRDPGTPIFLHICKHKLKSSINRRREKSIYRLGVFFLYLYNTEFHKLMIFHWAF